MFYGDLDSVIALNVNNGCRDTHYLLPYGQTKRDLVSREYNYYNTGKLSPTFFNISSTNKNFTSQLHSAHSDLYR